MKILGLFRKVAKYYVRKNEYVTGTGRDLLGEFIDLSELIEAPKVLEIGTCRFPKGPSTRRDSWVPHSSEYVGTDIAAGEDVDIPADVHRLTETFGHERFDVIISCSAFEHFKYPLVAAHEIMRVMKIGGIVFVQTHQSYPLHAAPYDYFRFSREALASLFGTKMGFEVIATDYEFPVRLKAKETPEVSFLPAYLNTRLIGKKTATTPEEYVYEYEGDISGDPIS